MEWKKHLVFIIVLFTLISPSFTTDGDQVIGTDGNTNDDKRWFEYGKLEEVTGANDMNFTVLQEDLERPGHFIGVRGRDLCTISANGTEELQITLNYEVAAFLQFPKHHDILYTEIKYHAIIWYDRVDKSIVVDGSRNQTDNSDSKGPTYKNPTGMCLALDENKFYVADTGNNRIFRLERSSGNGTPEITEFDIINNLRIPSPEKLVLLGHMLMIATPDDIWTYNVKTETRLKNLSLTKNGPEDKFQDIAPVTATHWFVLVDDHVGVHGANDLDQLCVDSSQSSAIRNVSWKESTSDECQPLNASVILTIPKNDSEKMMASGYIYMIDKTSFGDIRFWRMFYSVQKSDADIDQTAAETTDSEDSDSSAVEDGSSSEEEEEAIGTTTAGTANDLVIVGACAGVGCLILIMVIVILAICLMKKRKKCDTIQPTPPKLPNRRYRRGEDDYENYNLAIKSQEASYADTSNNYQEENYYSVAIAKEDNPAHRTTSHSSDKGSEIYAEVDRFPPERKISLVDNELYDADG